MHKHSYGQIKGLDGKDKNKSSRPSDAVDAAGDTDQREGKDVREEEGYGDALNSKTVYTHKKKQACFNIERTNPNNKEFHLSKNLGFSRFGSFSSSFPENKTK